MEEKKEIIQFLNEIYNQNGISGLKKNNLIGTKYFNYLLKNKKYYMDIEEYCCELIGKSDEYIIYVSVCND
jgi:hypothetical protein